MKHIHQVLNPARFMNGMRALFFSLLNGQYFIIHSSFSL